MLLLSLFFSAFTSFSQNVPASRRVDWSIAGIAGGIPCRSTIYNFVTAFSGDNTGATDNSVKLINALNSTPADAVIYFPNGTYKFTNTVNVPSNKVIRGQSVTGTLLNFTLTDGKNCFNMVGVQTATSTTVTASVTKGNNTLNVANATAFNIGDDILMEQVNNAAIANSPASWADNLRGQLFVITGKAGNTLTLDRTFTLDYNITDAITVYKLNLIKSVGFESLTIDRLDANFSTGNETFMFDLTANCWMRCVRSLRTGRYHVYLNNTRNAEVRGCYFYESKDYNGGGNGYGVLCQDHVGECLIENNIFRKLRHALIVKEGASRNVYGYNYSREATWGSSGFPADISIHGHYPYRNLFESNIVQRVTITDAWGKAGPDNTVFRNRIESTEDVWIQDYSDYQNLEANEVTGAGSTIIIDNDGTINDPTIIQVANNIGGTIDFAPGSAVLNSYYLSAAPSFFGAMPWPAIGSGTPYNTRTIPARARYNTYVGSSNIQDLMYDCSCAALPVELQNFNIEKENSGALLTWTTASEKQSDSFNVERSSDGKKFEVIGTRKAAGNSSSVLNYSFNDMTPLEGVSYYRLAQYDIDGTVNYTKVLSFENNAESVISLYPNPFTTEVILKVNSFAGEEISISVTDVAGKEIFKSIITSSEINFGKEFLPGVYMVYVEIGGEKRAMKLVKN
ncbi:MAG: T9SS type A sorting domain-containing protein [Cytophagaceae bacterium]|nr:T9SS type A sorting domain-containing protein [Cytophagaceae bacterium]